ncbi:MAG: hypothetical protein ACXACC_10640 [Promethearchaeota archaeon]|jgi:hypothetical protein
MTESLLNKVFFLAFFMAAFVVIKHIVAIVRKLKGDGYKTKYEVTKMELILLWVSVSYLLSTIFTGIKL